MRGIHRARSQYTSAEQETVPAMQRSLPTIRREWADCWHLVSDNLIKRYQPVPCRLWQKWNALSLAPS